MSDPARWTTVAGIAAVVRRRWDAGDLLRAYADGDPFPRVEVPLRGPSAADLGEHFDEARAWANDVYRGARGGRAYDVVRTEVGGRHAGRTELPGRAVVADYAQAWHLLGTADVAVAFRALVAQAADVPAAQRWALAHPLRAIELVDDWPAVLAAYGWLVRHRDSGLYLRQVDAPGVDTKLIDRHRSALAAMLDVPAGAASFVRALGLAAKPAMVRLRFDPEVLGFPAGVTEASFRLDELRAARARPRAAMIVENEITYLSAPVPAGAVVLWGKGYDADHPASLDWLADTPVLYWGDIDTHGFAILNRVRARLPHVRSVLMDRATLLAHEERWGREGHPTSVSLPHLDPAEAALYTDLVTDRYGTGVRLEQERIDWSWAVDRLA